MAAEKLPRQDLSKDPLMQYREAKNDLWHTGITLGALEGAIVATTGYLFLQERHAEKQAQKVVSEFVDDSQAPTTAFIEHLGTTFATSQAGKYGIQYHERIRKELKQSNPEAISFAQEILLRTTGNAIVERLIESDTLLNLGDEVTQTAHDLTSKSDLITRAKGIYAEITAGSPLSTEHVTALLGELRVANHMVEALVPAIRTIEPHFVNIVRTLNEAPGALRGIIENELGGVINFDPERHMMPDQIDDTLNTMLTTLGIQLPKGVSLEELAKAMRTEYILDNAESLLGTESGSTQSPLSTAVRLIGSLDHHQFESSQISEGETPTRR